MLTLIFFQQDVSNDDILVCLFSVFSRVPTLIFVLFVWKISISHISDHRICGWRFSKLQRWDYALQRLALTTFS